MVPPELQSRLELAERALRAAELPCEGETRGTPSEIDALAQTVLNIRAEIAANSEMQNG